MSIYEEYAKNKLEIKILTERLKEIEPVIDHYEPILEEFWKNLFKGKSRKTIG